jgi:50S ribosomal protein L16 3-hydroxylase
VDRYDVFLVQGAGRRRWRITSEPLDEEDLVPGIELRVLREFEPDEEWILEAGDLLYLPPRFAHEGVAVGESMTCSIGFRTPDPLELGAGFLSWLAESGAEIDPPGHAVERPVADPGELDEDARRHLSASMRRLFADEDALDRWAGRFLTEPARGTYPAASETPCDVADLRRGLEAGEHLYRSAVPHFAWLRDRTGAVRVYVGGEERTFDPGEREFARLICGREPLDGDALAPWLERPRPVEALVEWIDRGFLIRVPADRTDR